MTHILFHFIVRFCRKFILVWRRTFLVLLSQPFLSDCLHLRTNFSHSDSTLSISRRWRTWRLITNLDFPSMFFAYTIVKVWQFNVSDESKLKNMRAKPAKWRIRKNQFVLRNHQKVFEKKKKEKMLRTWMNNLLASFLNFVCLFSTLKINMKLHFFLSIIIIINNWLFLKLLDACV